MEKKYSRRNLFRKVFLRREETRDPLFERYKRRNYGLRRYEPIDASAEANRIGNITSGLAPYSGTWNTASVLHLLRRTQFGFKFSEVNGLVQAGLNSSVNSLLTIPNTVTNPPVNYYQNVYADEGNVPYGSDWTQHAFNSNSIGNTTNVYRITGLSAWNLAQGLNQQLNIKEKMTWFWYHFIPIDFNTVRVSQNIYCGSNSARISHEYIQNFRNNGLGNFKTLIRNVATQPAMMYYLNNQANTSSAPDENFAREIMELFTLGKDPLSQFTEADVIAAAKVLTGWRVQNLNTHPTTTSFVASQHDTSNKTFSAFFNNTTITNNGSAELDAFIDLIFSKSQVVSEYICRRLYRYFVYYDIDANIEANVIVPLAQHFVANNWEIAPVLDKLFKSQHFYDMANYGVYIKSPFDLILGSMRTFNLNYNVSDATNHHAQYYVWGAINTRFLVPNDQSMGNMPNVAGWPAYHQSPNFHEYWINSNTVQKRAAFIDAIFNGFNLTYNGLTTRIEVDVIAWVSQFSPATVEDPDALVNECVNYLLPLDISATAKTNLKVQNLLSNQVENHYWSDAWNNYISNPTNNGFKNIVKSRLKSLLLAITQLSEYQLM
jgi:uncharacterized protein (DUF1800 family)